MHGTYSLFKFQIYLFPHSCKIILIGQIGILLNSFIVRLKSKKPMTVECIQRRFKYKILFIEALLSTYFAFSRAIMNCYCHCKIKMNSNVSSNLWELLFLPSLVTILFFFFGYQYAVICKIFNSLRYPS